MKLRKAKRIYSTKVLDLVHRSQIFEYGYPYEFINKMTEQEIKEYFKEVREQLATEEIACSKNINSYNIAFKAFLQDREEVYQIFKRNHGHSRKF